MLYLELLCSGVEGSGVAAFCKAGLREQREQGEGGLLGQMGELS